MIYRRADILITGFWGVQYFKAKAESGLPMETQVWCGLGKVSDAVTLRNFAIMIST